MEGGKALAEACEASSSKKKLKISQTSKDNNTTEFVGEPNMVSAKLQESDAGSKSRDSTHPLLVDHILEKIFKLIIDPIRENGQQRPVDAAEISRDVQSFRLVCNTWRVVATSVFRKARSIMDIGSEDVMEYPDFELGRFLEVMKNSTVVPFQRYRINRSVLTSQNSHLMKLFLEVCGPEMVELHIAICGNDLNLRFIIPGDVSHLKLEKLSTFEIYTRPGYDPSPLNGGDVAEFIGFLLAITTNLKDCTMEYFLLWQSLPNGVQKFFEKLPGTLKSIKLHTIINTISLDFYLNTLRKNNVKLETFEFGFWNEQISSGSDETIHAFFEGQSQSLKKLIVPAICLAMKPESKKPVIFDQLHSLKLWAMHLPISFSERFPKLTVLDLSSTVDDEPSCLELLSITAPAESVTELSLPCISLGANTAEKIAKCFPNVRKLALELHFNFIRSNPFQHAFVYFHQIEELTISLFRHIERWIENGESLLCNITSHDCQRALFKKTLDDFNAKDMQEAPSILLLKKLKKLTLKRCSALKFTDFAAHFIFLKMESLEELHIDSESRHMSADYVSRLKNKLKILNMGE